MATVNEEPGPPGVWGGLGRRWHWGKGIIFLTLTLFYHVFLRIIFMLRQFLCVLVFPETDHWGRDEFFKIWRLQSVHIQRLIISVLEALRAWKRGCRQGEEYRVQWEGRRRETEGPSNEPPQGGNRVCAELYLRTGPLVGQGPTRVRKKGSYLLCRWSVVPRPHWKGTVADQGLKRVQAQGAIALRGVLRRSQNPLLVVLVVLPGAAHRLKV